jgi:hypothetical protein
MNPELSAVCTLQELRLLVPGVVMCFMCTSSDAETWGHCQPPKVHRWAWYYDLSSWALAQRKPYLGIHPGIFVPILGHYPHVVRRPSRVVLKCKCGHRVPKLKGFSKARDSRELVQVSTHLLPPPPPVALCHFPCEPEPRVSRLSLHPRPIRCLGSGWWELVPDLMMWLHGRHGPCQCCCSECDHPMESWLT